MHDATAPTHQSVEDRDAILAYWKQRISELPDLRLDKVMQIRDALARSSYDADEALDATVARLSEDIGVLCRDAH